MELIQQKMEIAERAGRLNIEIKRLSEIAEDIQLAKVRNGGKPDGIFAETHVINSKYNLRTCDIDKNGSELHDALLLFLNSQIDKRKAELNELIKIPQ